MQTKNILVISKNPVTFSYLTDAISCTRKVYPRVRYKAHYWSDAKKIGTLKEADYPDKIYYEIDESYIEFINLLEFVKIRKILKSKNSLCVFLKNPEFDMLQEPLIHWINKPLHLKGVISSLPKNI